MGKKYFYGDLRDAAWKLTSISQLLKRPEGCGAASDLYGLALIVEDVAESILRLAESDERGELQESKNQESD